MSLKFFFDQNPGANSVDVYLFKETERDQYVAEPMELKFIKRELYSADRTPPTFSFKGWEAQEFFPALVDALGRSGYTYESSDKGELKATKIHLEDMRTLIFRKDNK